jgi:hypothetical protein
MATAFHPQTDGATESANCSIGQVLRSVVHDDQKDWAAKCPMVELVLNSNVSATTGFAPFELNHGYMPRSDLPVTTDTTFKGVSQFAQQARWSLMAAHNAILEHHVDQMFHANRKRRESEIYEVNDRVYLLTQNLTLLKGRGQEASTAIHWTVPCVRGPQQGLDGNSRVTGRFKESACVADLPYQPRKAVHRYQR